MTSQKCKTFNLCSVILHFNFYFYISEGFVWILEFSQGDYRQQAVV
jgi:hypothetical protein